MKGGGEVVVFDKAYVDFKHLKTLADRDVSWVTLSKDNMLYEVVEQQASGKRRYVRKKCRILSDEHIRLTDVKTTEHYPEELRLVTAASSGQGIVVFVLLARWQFRIVFIHIVFRAGTSYNPRLDNQLYQHRFCV